MKKTKKTAITAIAILFGAGVLSSYISDKDSAGWEFMPDMQRSPAIEPYVDYGFIKERVNKDIALTKSALHPPIHTIPYRAGEKDWEIYLPYQRQANSFAPKTHGLLAEHGWNLSNQPGGDYFESAKDVNPIVLTKENESGIFEQGKELYTINCAHCHGAKGDGKGPMVESGAYAGVPDYHNLATLKEGQMFFSIYYGKGMMGAHAQLLDNKEIWTIVHYIKKLQDENYGATSIETKDEVLSDSTNVADLQNTEN